MPAQAKYLSMPAQAKYLILSSMPVQAKYLKQAFQSLKSGQNVFL